MNPDPASHALIIDDETVARADLRRLLAPHVEVTVVGEAGTLAAARERLAQADYDLVFLDIQLRGCSGFDLVSHVRPGARIVFVTAHDRYAVRAFEVNALDYLLKPVDPDRLAATLQRLCTTAAEPTVVEAAPRVALQPGDTLFLKTATTAGRFVRLADIGAILAEENYSEVRLANGERVFTRRSMKAWEESLPADAFIRVHRGAFVALAHLTGLERESAAAPEVRVVGVGEPIPVSRRLWPEVRARLGGT